MQTNNLKIDNNLREKFSSEIRPKLKEILAKKNIYEVPALEKIVINVGFGKLAPEKNTIEQIGQNLAKISGQKPIFTKAKKAIAGFKIRKGQIIGAKVTLRGKKMYDFLEKLVKIVLPRIRDFRGVSDKSFDKQGNYTLGFKEMNVFPEIEYVRGDKFNGLEVIINTTTKSDEEAKVLLKELGMPFKEEVKVKDTTSKVGV